MRSKPDDPTRAYVTDSPGKTDGRFSLSVSPGTSTRLPRKKPVTKRAPSNELAVSRLTQVPPNALVHVNEHGRVVLTTYSQPATERVAPVPTVIESFPHPGLTRIPKKTNGR